MEALSKLMEIGKAMGLEGTVLLGFIKERETAENEKEVQKRVARGEKNEKERLAREAEREEKDLKMQLDK